MAYISFGEYNSLYKYMWLFVLFQIIYEYLFGSGLPEKIKIKYSLQFPKTILVQETFNFLFMIISSYILWKVELNKNKTIPKSSPKLKETASEIPYIVYKYQNNLNAITVKYFFLIIFLLYFSSQLIVILCYSGLKELDFWMLEIVFICYITIITFNMPIYNHKKIAIFIIIVFGIIFKVLSIINILNDEKDKKIYKDYIWIMPIGIIVFMLITLLRGYSYCKLKWIFDIKYISIFKLLSMYGIFGSIFCFIGSLMSSIIRCADQEKNQYIEYICKKNKNGNRYFDHFIIFFENIFNKEKWYIYTFLELIEMALSFLNNLFMMQIIKYLNPEYLVCSKYIKYFICQLIMFIIDYDIKKIYDLLAQFFSILASLIYLEFIELLCYQLNYNLKKNIKKEQKKILMIFHFMILII